MPCVIDCMPALCSSAPPLRCAAPAALCLWSHRLLGAAAELTGGAGPHCSLLDRCAMLRLWEAIYDGMHTHRHVPDECVCTIAMHLPADLGCILHLRGHQTCRVLLMEAAGDYATPAWHECMTVVWHAALHMQAGMPSSRHGTSALAARAAMDSSSTDCKVQLSCAVLA